MSTQKDDGEALASERKTKKLDKNEEIKQDEPIKLLILGALGSGKTTIFKQFLALSGLEKDRLLPTRVTVYSNLVNGIKNLLWANSEMADDDVEVTLCEKKLAGLIEDIDNDFYGYKNFPTEVAKVIKMAWADKGLQETWAKRYDFQLQNSLAYFVKDIDRISSSDYVPDIKDYFHSRSITTGVVEEVVKIHDKFFHVVDVGGARGERRRWLYRFNNVTLLFFVVSLIGYNQVLYEDESTNRMKEALALFKMVIESFPSMHIELILNKYDLFKDAIRSNPITKCFPDYKGKLTEQDQYEYILKKFVDLAPMKISAYRTCAIDTIQIKLILRAVEASL